MTEKTRTQIEEMIEELTREIALNQALAEDPRYARTVAGSRICRERAEVAYLAAMHLVEELTA